MKRRWAVMVAGVSGVAWLVALTVAVALSMTSGAAASADRACSPPSPQAIAQATEAMAAARLIHVNWAQWQEATPNWRELVTPESPGGPEHHRRWIAAYDQVIAVLHSASC